MCNSKLFKQVLFYLVFIFITLNCVFSQISSDINDELYEDIVQWEISGKIQKLPIVRPYPLSLIKDILLKVMECDDEIAASQAAYHYRRYFSDGVIRFGSYLDTEFAAGDYSGSKKQFNVNPFVSANAEFLDKGSVNFYVTPIFSNIKRGKEILPVGKSRKYDYEADTANIGPINIFLSSSSLVAYGSPDVYVQAGVVRSNFGDFFNDGILLNANANQAGHISFSLNKDPISFSMGMLLLTSTNVRGEARSSQKYLYFHSIRYYPVTSIGLTFYESVITGPRFDFTYLLPASLFMPIQQLIGYSNENVMMGIQFDYIMNNSLKIIGDICVDDFGFNDFVKLNFDTKMKFAAQLGLQFVPSSNNMLKIFQLDYTIVTPYMYAHSQYDNRQISYGTNYQNHTTNGKPLGSQIPPNSDKINLSFKLNIIGNLKFNMTSTIIRHCNINENLPFDCIKQYLMEDEANVNTSGNIFDYPDAGNGYFSYCQHHFMFLTQPTKYVCMQNDIEFEYTWELGNRHTITAYIDWLFQYERNAGIDRNIYTGGHSESEATEALAATQLVEWRSLLTNKVSNFFSLGVKYTY